MNDVLTEEGWTKFQKYCRYRLSAIDTGNNLYSKCTYDIDKHGKNTTSAITVRCSYDVCPLKGGVR